MEKLYIYPNFSLHPTVFVLKCGSIDEAIQWNNEVEAGLSSSLFTKNLGDVFKVTNLFTTCILYLPNDKSKNYALLLG